MKILVIGCEGFVGRYVFDALLSSHEVHGASRKKGERATEVVDMTSQESIMSLLAVVEPEIIIDCSGIVENNERAQLNTLFTQNLLEAVRQAKHPIRRVILSGSAAEYGVVDSSDIPVSENVTPKDLSLYGASKLAATRLALEYRSAHNLPVVVGRIFNPLGVNMHEKFLISRIGARLQEIKQGRAKTIEVTRLDSQRDYIDVEDVALAIKAIVEGEPLEAIYNIGSGRATSNLELIELIIKHSKMDIKPELVETSDAKEPLVAIQANIKRISQEFNWHPTKTLDETVRSIVDARD